MKRYNQQQNQRIMTTLLITCLTFLLIGNFHAFKTVSTSVINDQTSSMRLHNIQSDQEYKQGNVNSKEEKVPLSINDESCLGPLGMEHGHIDDEDITASSAFDFKSVGPQNARLRKDHFGGAWCPKKTIAPGIREWIQIDLKKAYRITRTATQGRYGSGRGQEYAESFQLEYWRPGFGNASDSWVTYKNHSGHTILKGNTNTYVVNVQLLNPPIVASKVRFIPHSRHSRTVCMRVEVFGCLYNDEKENGDIIGKANPIRYSIPDSSDEFAPNFYLDDVYDGNLNKENKRLEGGLGALSDGLFGGRVILSDQGINPVHEAHGWVGWRNTKNGRPLVIEFEFGGSTPRVFKSVTLTTYCQLDLGIQPFSQMLAYFSIASNNANSKLEKYHPQYLKSVNRRDLVDYQPQNITLDLDDRVGNSVKLELYFENKWLLLSEIQFDSLLASDLDIISNKNYHNEIIDNGSEDEVVDFHEKKANEKSVSKHTEKEGGKEIKDDSNQVVLSDTPERKEDTYTKIDTIDLSKDDASPDGKKKNSSKGMSQMFIGLVIGVLGVTVLLLVVTILVMYRKNKQKVFNKHSIFKSPLSAATHNGMTGPTGMGVGMTPTSHMLRDLQGGMGGGTSGNGSTTNTGSSNGGPGKLLYHDNHGSMDILGVDGCDESTNSIYQEPYPRLVLASRNRNSSCGRLFDNASHDYEEHGNLLPPRQPSVEGHLSKLSNGSSSKFGSTPLFSQIMQPLPPPPPQNPTATTRPPRLPTGRMQHSMKHPGCPTVPASISCHENIVRNDYSIPGGSTIPISHSLAQPIQVISGPEGFYAATDILSKTDTSNSPPSSKHHYTNSKFQNPYGLEDQHQIYNQINNNQPTLPPNIFHGNNQHHHHLEPSTFNPHHQQPNNNNSNRTKRGVMSQQRGAVSQQSTPQLKKHLMYNQHNTQASNPINYNNNQNHYQRQQQSFDHYSPLLIADDENDQQKTNHYDNNPHQPEHHSMNGNSFSPMMIHDASLRYQNSISNPHESFVDDFDDLDVTFNQHVYTPKALDPDNESPFTNNEKLSKNMPEILRSTLRVVEKLGEGGFGMVHLCETDSSILTLTSNSKSSPEYKDQSSPTSFHNQDVPEHNNDRILRKASTSSSSGSSKGSTGLKGQGRGITFNSLKDSENTFNSTNESVVVVVRSLWRDASEEESQSFMSDMRNSWLLPSHPNVARVLAACSQGDPVCVVSEWVLPGDGFVGGDLCEFLKQNSSSFLPNSSKVNNTGFVDVHNTSTSSKSSSVVTVTTSSSSPGSSTNSNNGLSCSTLIHIATQIASGMKHLESLGIVHRDLAARNCLIGQGYAVKISDFAMFRPAYSSDYFKTTENVKDIPTANASNQGDVIPLRWIPWEVYIMRLWSTKSDVWSFGVTMWELFSLCKEGVPLSDLTNQQVIENLQHWFHSDGFHLTPSKPTASGACTKEIFDLIMQCWSREPEDRPRFAEIYQFFQKRI